MKYSGVFLFRKIPKIELEAKMINFEEELKNFQPSLEVEEAEAAIYNRDLTDVTDIIAEMIRDMKPVNRA